MILTGKCREGFINFMCKNHKHIKWCDYQTMSEVILNALIIDYFSTLKYKGQDFWLYVFDAYYKIKIESMTINDVNIQAIEKANDLINEELTINL
jgi:hypothetical protein